MWYLTSENDRRIIYVLPSKEVIIGRNADSQLNTFVMSDDASISRKHATLSVTDCGLCLQDLGSRYGTFVNNSTEQIEINTVINLNDKDVVKFGKLMNIWLVHKFNIVTCSSTLKGENLINLKSCLNKLGGTLRSDWDDSCNYLTMPVITLTIKVVLALVQGSLIVTTEFWDKCLIAANTNSQLPDPNKYIPQIVESTLNKDLVSFLPNDNRKSLFSGQKIVFFSRKQLEMYKLVLVKSGGTPLLLSDSKITKSMLCEQGMIVIQYNAINTETETLKSQINEIVNHLKNKGKRVIADAEIGLAVLYCSTEKYCNPDFNFSSEVIKQNEVQQSANILAAESQEPNNKAIKKENIVINESLTSECLPNNNSKRRLSNDSNDNYGNAMKKVATETVTSCNNRSIKRKNSGDTNGELNPNKKLATTNADNDDDLFNFTTPANKQKNPEKKLNLKAVKRKQDMRDGDEDDLFNFVEEKKSVHGDGLKQGIFKTKNASGHAEDEVDDISPAPKNNNSTLDNVDISALRGSKLEELMKNNMNITTNINIHKLKKEITDDLDEKMNNLDLGITIVTVKKELIVKKEPHFVNSHNNTVKNFKKFQKVWPLKYQVTVIPRSMSAGATDMSNRNEICSQSYDDIAE
ncbi:nbs [Aphomia sociella]